MLFILGALLGLGIMFGLEKAIPEKWRPMLWVAGMVLGFGIVLLTI